MSRPLGLSQADYDELENPSRAAEPVFHPLVLTWWESTMWLTACALFTVCFAFLLVTAQLCRIGKKP
jgi:hypothetical protein